MPASAAITNGSLVSETSPSSTLIGSSCACAEGAAMGAMVATAARNSAPNSALVRGFRMIDLPSTHRSGAARLADAASAHRQSTTKHGIKIAPAGLDVVNDILLRMNAILSSSLRPTHATFGGYVHWSQEPS